MEMCSLKVLELEGSPSRMLLRLMAERGCTSGHLVDYLQALGNSEALQCLKPSGKPELNQLDCVKPAFMLSYILVDHLCDVFLAEKGNV